MLFDSAAFAQGSAWRGVGQTFDAMTANLRAQRSSVFINLILEFHCE
jgi:hypothetical protein